MVDNLLFPEFGDLLYQCEVIDDEELELIEGKPTKKGQIRELIKILKGKQGENVFKDFCQVLRDCPADYSFVADDLENTEIKDSDEDLVDGGDQSYKDKVEELMKQLWTQTQTMVDMQQQHRVELEELKQQLGTKFNAINQSSFGVVGSPKGLSSVGLGQPDAVDGSQFMKKYVAEFMKRPSDDAGFSWNRVMGRFRPRSLEEIENIACRVGIDVMQFFLHAAGHNLTLQPTDQYTEAMRQMTKLVLDEHGDKLKQCVAEMDKDEMNGYLSIDRLADELFEDDKTVNWGRIVAWYSFWAQCVSSLPLPIDKLDECVEFYGKFVGFYVARRLHVWISREGGWSAFIEYYRQRGALQSRQITLLMLFDCVVREVLYQYPCRP